ncbi:MAG: hypothetical protein WC630_00990 [Candidatus Babeliales bacterium]
MRSKAKQKVSKDELKKIYGVHGSIHPPTLKLRRTLTTNGIKFSHTTKPPIIIATLAGVFVFCILGIPFTHWWFNGCDDFGGAYIGFVTKTWRQLFYFFINGHINQALGPSNLPHQQATITFFNAYYRPVYLIFITLQYWLFGLNAYGYFLCNVFFHALNTSLLVLIFSWLTSLLPALCAALLFAFHPQIGYRFGAIVNLHYYVSVSCILGALIFYKRYLDQQHIWPYALSCWLFACSLFTRESSLVFPAIITLGTYVYDNRNSLWCAIKKAAGFWIIAISFLLLRVSLFPLHFVTTTSPSLALFFRTKFNEGLVFLYDAFWLSWLPWGHPILRGALLAILITLFMWLFVTNTRKKFLTCFLISATLMLWPAYVGCYSPRYIYEALPFILLFFIGCFQWAPLPLQHFKKIGFGLLPIAVVFFMVLTLDNMQHRERKMHVVAQALHNLTNYPGIRNKPLYLLSYPMDGLGDQPTDIIRAMLNNAAAVIYTTPAAAFVQIGAHIVTPSTWRNVSSDYYNENFATITPTPEGVHYHIHKPDKIYFITQEGVQDFTIHIERQLIKENPCFLAWDAVHGLFKTL